ncbi:MAG TPA: LUD domain-containing protein [Anaeromyxobacteraceae bacterium]|nr:LUD domain-containing protein [Anaeromyxobacteraceae bacterium]
MRRAREEILGQLRAARDRPGPPPGPVPATALVGSRLPGDPQAELALLLKEIEGLKGVTRRIAGAENLGAALAELVGQEGVKRATCWRTPEMGAWGVAPALEALGVEIVPADADKHLVASCELGVTGVDAALPETGTLVLTSSPERPRLASLLPRVHLALLRPEVLRPDLHQVFAESREAGYVVLVTGPSRTADIELTLTLGVHGPKSLHVWVMEPG